jgi:hypothetical protein
MRKFLLVVWLVSLVALLCSFGDIHLLGATLDRTRLSGDLGAVCGGSFAVWAGPIDLEGEKTRSLVVNDVTACL